MKLDGKAAAWTFGLAWGGLMLCVGAGNLVNGAYGQAFLDVMASVYPGYHAEGTFADAIVGALYGIVDGAIGGLVLAWLYNRLSA
jgi:hypothetical protein